MLQGGKKGIPSQDDNWVNSGFCLVWQPVIMREPIPTYGLISFPWPKGVVSPTWALMTKLDPHDQILGP